MKLCYKNRLSDLVKRFIIYIIYLIVMFEFIEKYIYEFDVYSLLVIKNDKYLK